MEANVRCNVVYNQILCNHLAESSNITDEREGDFFVRNCMVSHVIVVLRGVLYFNLSCKYLYFLVSLLSLHWIKEETTCKEVGVCYVCHCIWLFSYVILLTPSIMKETVAETYVRLYATIKKSYQNHAVFDGFRGVTYKKGINIPPWKLGWK